MTKIILLASFLASVRLVLAACSISGTTTIQNYGDATALASCSTFAGSIAIATSTTDNINIPNIKMIQGNLIASNVSQMTQFGADSLEVITDTFGLNDVQILNQLDFPQLTTARNIIWQGLPNLNTLNFVSQIQQASNVDIQNTFLSSLEGINLRAADKFYVANNGMLQQVSLQITNISSSLTLVDNGDRLVASFPNLIRAYNLTFRDIPSISLPSLKFVNGSLGFYQNAISNIVCPNLTRVGGTFSIVSNKMVHTPSFPLLTTIDGGFQIANNTKLNSLSGFPKLRNIGGAFDCTGSFANIDLPSLGDVRGAFNLQSTEDISEPCSRFKSISGPNMVIKGKFTCNGQQQSKNGGGSSNGSNKSAASIVLPPDLMYGVVVATVLGASVATLFFL